LPLFLVLVIQMLRGFLLHLRRTGWCANGGS
jgi:hypothetical protein